MSTRGSPWSNVLAISLVVADYGLGWAIAKYKGQCLLEHGGGTAGFSSDLSFLPDADLGIAILTNAQNANLFCSAVRSRAIELAFGQPMEMDGRLSPRLEQELGNYANPALGQITLSLSGGKLILTTAAFTTELQSLGDDTYLLWDPPLAGALIRFSRGDHGPRRFDLDEPRLRILHADRRRLHGPRLCLLSL